MHQLEFIERLPDPVWRDIPITSLEKKLIQTKAFNRLRSVRQMSLAELQYPGATHTRYQHSLGAMHVAALLAELLWPILPENTKKHQPLQALRIALLLHDVGHPPYSHLVEHAFLKYPDLLKVSGNTESEKKLRDIFGEKGYSHEAFSSYIIQNDLEIKDILETAHKSILLPEASEIALLAVGQAKFESLSAFNSLVSGDVDADRIDYILRDSLHCGLSTGLDFYHMRDNILCEPEDGGYRLVFLREALPFVDSLLLARYNLNFRVHQSSSNRIASQMLSDMLEKSLRKMSEEERAKIILDIHLKYTTRDFENFISMHVGENSLEKILSGQLYNENLSIRTSEIHPVGRLNAYKIAALESAIQKLQDRFRFILGDKNIIVDVIDPKPPNLTMLIQDSQNHRTNVFDKHFISHGIYVDSIMGLNIYIYSPKNKLTDSQISWKDIDKALFKRFKGIICSYHEPTQEQTDLKALIHYEIQESCKRLLVESLRQYEIERDDFLLTVLQAIDEEVKDTFKVSQWWVRGDGDFQRFIRSIEEELSTLKKLHLRKQFNWTYDGGKAYSVELFKVLERLSYMGLIDHVHKLIGHNSGFGTRLDRTLTGWGYMYCKDMLENSYIHLREIIRKRQHAAVDLFSECMDIKNKRKLEFNRVKREKEANRYRELIKEIRKVGACPLEF